MAIAMPVDTASAEMMGRLAYCTTLTSFSADARNFCGMQLTADYFA
jgi:hypothetical protein